MESILRKLALALMLVALLSSATSQHAFAQANDGKSSRAVVAAQANVVTVGVNLVNAPYNLSAAEQESILDTMQRGGVQVIRGAIPGPKGVDWAGRVYARDIRMLWIVDLAYAAGTQWPHPPQGFLGMWGEPRLSTADPDRFRTYFGGVLANLEAKGIVLAGFELGNEINWAGFNADFTLPGEGRVLGGNDLLSNPKGQQIARGYLQYLKCLAVLKDIRDHSRLNQHTPIISAGLTGMGLANSGVWIKADGVGVDATLDFLRANGLDNLVDRYGLHYYPNAADAAGRLLQLTENGVADECQPIGSGHGKPCWITEWGVGGVTGTCPAIDDSSRLKLVREIRGYFGPLVAQGRLKGLFFYTWQGDVHATKEDPYSAFRCGTLTDSGKLAFSPL